MSQPHRTMLHDPTSIVPAACQDCDWIGPEKDLLPIDDLGDRVTAGEVVPLGQCPDCGALCHTVDEED